MKTLAILTALALAGATTTLFSQEPPPMEAPAKEHQWLHHFIGEWDSEVEVFHEPGKPPLKGKGTETSKALGAFWVVSQGESEIMGMKFSSALTLGYDPKKKKYIGSWVDSMGSHFWTYEGTVDASGKNLTLHTEGPCPMEPGKLCKFREVTEIKDKDNRVFTSWVVGDDGKETMMVRVISKRKK
jgi:hypothetical protein